MKCFLDLDGVLADFMGGVARAHGMENPYDRASSAGEYECADLMGLTLDDFWNPCDQEFWAGLDLMPDAADILACVEQRFGAENVCLLTSPARNAQCASGKVRWIEKHFPDYSRRFLIGPPKHFCAHENAVLVDDYDVNVNKFREHGGRAVLLPRPWNPLHQKTYAVGHLINELHRLNGG